MLTDIRRFSVLPNCRESERSRMENRKNFKKGNWHLIVLRDCRAVWTATRALILCIINAGRLGREYLYFFVSLVQGRKSYGFQGRTNHTFTVGS